MALSGSIQHPFGYDHYLKLTWSATQSVSNNRSTVTVNLYIGAGLSAPAIQPLSGSQPGKITIDGVSYNVTGNLPAIRRFEEILIGQATRNITHDVYGNKTFTLKAELTINAEFTDGINYVYIGTVSVPSKSFALNKINRVSTISVSPNPVNFGSNLTINISRKFSSAKHTLKYQMGNKSGTIVSETTATSYSWTVPTTLMNEIPNSTSADIIITCETYDGSTKVGTSTATVTANVPSSYRPTFTSLSIEDANTKVKNNVGRFLKGQSRVKVTVVGAAATGGATIKSIVVYVDGKAYHGSQITSDVINKTGTINVYAVITDSRNRTYSTQSSPNQVTFYDYFKPLVSTLTIQRCNSDGTPNTKGQYAKVQIQGSYSRVDGLNQGNIKIESSLRGQNNWKTEFNQSLPSGSNNFSYTQIINNQGQLFNVALSYDIRVTITDEVVDPVRYTEVLPTQNVPFDIGPAGAAVGKMWEPGKGAFQVGGESTFEGIINALAGVKVDGDQVIEVGSNANGYYVKFAGGLQVCWASIPLGNVLEFGTGTYTDPYRTGSTQWTYPSAFVSTPIVLGTSWVSVTVGAQRPHIIACNLLDANTCTLQAFAATGDSTEQVARGSCGGIWEVEVMRILFVPQVYTEAKLQYRFEGEKIIATALDKKQNVIATDEFDFTEFGDGELQLHDEFGNRTIETTLPFQVILSAKRENGVLSVELLNFLANSADATPLERFPEWFDSAEYDGYLQRIFIERLKMEEEKNGENEVEG